ncbi:alpha/beta-hydrolase [Trematosphaeria pertusa]|uniref:Alpha/beta-hydrolase n=1 Tax=Trematosphaeria pertusa TaxID=390896 RepID=A0A6A6I3P3_9PLEO|nr:alpha/beta-hydrolase [Trematosphaeria pertusa]KAF2244886.1 alpha/beta-hydrolase [Trematosphaeria pertusa]
MANIRAFNPEIPQEEVDRLFQKLKDTRSPTEPIVPDAGKTMGLTVHFIHEKARVRTEKTIPLRLWLTKSKFQNVMKPLLEPRDENDPVFNLSQGPPRGWTLQDTARIYDALMKRLGYDSYAAQGDACKVVHTNMCPGAPPEGYKLSEREKTSLIALTRNGRAGERAIHENGLCTTLSLYFFTSSSIMTSMLCYYNNVRHEVYTEFNAREENLIMVPLGVSSFPFDAYPVFKAAPETTTTNLKDFGGHFACMECLNEMVSDMREFFGRF